MLMVKADAYGFGITEVAKATQDIVDAFGVVTIDEAEELKSAGVDKDILLCACDCDEILRAFACGAILGVHNKEQINALVNLSKNGAVKPEKTRIHIKADSGMHRLGFNSEEIKSAVRMLKNRGYCVEGVYSHLRDGTINQRECFEICRSVVQETYPSAIAHTASTHSMSDKRLRYDMVRLGIGAYTGAMRVTSQVVESRFLKAGELVGYGYHALSCDTNTAVVFGGYADGICRENPSDVYINGNACRVIGDVCMDTFIVDTGGYRAKVGEEVVLVDNACVDAVAKQRKTIEYCVYTAWKGRVKRCYNGQKTSESDGKR